MKIDFCKRLMQLNQKYFINFKNFIFYDGMLFGSKLKWWEKGERSMSHEGIDICYFLDDSGKIVKINSSIFIPALDTGIILTTVQDFLGYSIFVLSKIEQQNYIWAFGHMDLKKDLSPGKIVSENEIIGTISQAKNKKVPPHLHISIGIVKGAIQKIDWCVMNDDKYIQLINPLELMDLDYEVI